MNISHFTQQTVSSHYTLHTVNCTLHTSHCTLHTAYCTLHTAHCTLHTAHCTLHTQEALPGFNQAEIQQPPQLWRKVLVNWLINAVHTLHCAAGAVKWSVKWFNVDKKYFFPHYLLWWLLDGLVKNPRKAVTDPEMGEFSWKVRGKRSTWKSEIVMPKCERKQGDCIKEHIFTLTFMCFFKTFLAILG